MLTYRVLSVDHLNAECLENDGIKVNIPLSWLEFIPELDDEIKLDYAGRYHLEPKTTEKNN